MIIIGQTDIVEDKMALLRNKSKWNWKDFLKFWSLAHRAKKVPISMPRLDRNMIIKISWFLKTNPPNLADVIEFSVEHFPMELEKFLMNYKNLHHYMEAQWK